MQEQREHILEQEQEYILEQELVGEEQEKVYHS